jgi:hypothetical protein
VGNVDLYVDAGETLGIVGEARGLWGFCGDLARLADHIVDVL